MAVCLEYTRFSVLSQFLGHFRRFSQKLLKATASFISLRPSFAPPTRNNSAPAGRIFMNFSSDTSANENNSSRNHIR